MISTFEFFIIYNKMGFEILAGGAFKNDAMGNFEMALDTFYSTCYKARVIIKACDVAYEENAYPGFPPSHNIPEVS